MPQHFSHRLRMPLRLAPMLGVLVALTASLPALAAPAHKSTAARPSPATKAGLLAAEDRLFKAQVDHDVQGIAAGFADEALFMHANGSHQTKAEFIAAVQSGKLPYKSVSATERMALVSGDLGVTRGTMHLVVGDMNLTGTFLAAYVLRAGRWQMVSWQSTPPLQDHHD